MKITFHIPFRMDGDNHLAVAGSLPQLGAGNAAQGLRLAYHPARGIWTGSLCLPPNDVCPFDYQYALLDKAGQVLQEEGGKKRIFQPWMCPDRATVELRDHWKPPIRSDDVFETAPFRNILFRRTPADSTGHPSPAPSNGIWVRIRVPAPCVTPGQSLFLIGEIPCLGAWNIKKAVPMHHTEYPFWEADFFMPATQGSFAYKYAIGNSKKDLIWESGENRLFIQGEAETSQVVIVTDWPFRYPGGTWKGAGIAVPVFSLRTERDTGVGEFSDLKPLTDWAKQMGFSMLQLLPVNDTSAHQTWYDSYPYSLISVFALHPIYINLAGLVPPQSTIAQEIARQGWRLNQNPTIDYEDVMATKMALLQQIFQEDALSFLKSPPFQDFFRDHASWLRPYAAFCLLRDRYGTSDHRCWGNDCRGTAETIARLTDPAARHYNEITFHYYVQFHLHRQLAEASDYAREHGLFLKGDIPIGVARGSVETWVHPEWFHMDSTVGAPPDDFAEEGQNWGFPAYNWESMAADGYSWWQRRLRHLSRYFDAVRLDHVIGFFRIWTIPDQASTALKGRFCPAIALSIEKLKQSGIHHPDQLLARAIADEDGMFIPERPGDWALFHPGILMERTATFQSLDETTQDLLRRLYQDYFYRDQEGLWQATGLTKLSALVSATDMLICGEDLGMVPRCVPGVLERLGILSLRIQRMPVALGDLFGHPSAYPYLSVASPGTHDMATIRGWWEETDRAVIQFYYVKILGHQDIAPKSCSPLICGEIMDLHLRSASIWTIIPVQDLLGTSADLRHADPHTEKINDPATPHHNWNFRLHRSLEELRAQTTFNAGIRAMLRRTGRITATEEMNEA